MMLNANFLRLSCEEATQFFFGLSLTYLFLNI